MLISILHGLFYVSTFEAILAMIVIGFQPITIVSMFVPLAIRIVILVLDDREGLY